MGGNGSNAKQQKKKKSNKKRNQKQQISQNEDESVPKKGVDVQDDEVEVRGDAAIEEEDKEPIDDQLIQGETRIKKCDNLQLETL